MTEVSHFLSQANFSGKSHGMTKVIQKRALATRARLIETATNVVAEKGYEALRVEEVVQGAGVAKGTFFAHFSDKDALMDLLIGNRIDRFLDDLEVVAAPTDVAEFVVALIPVYSFMTCERYVFDLIMRSSGAAAVETVGQISTTFGRQGAIVGSWIAQGDFRKDVSPRLLSEGVLAFAVQAMGLKFCALHQDQSMETRLRAYLEAWLTPKA